MDSTSSGSPPPSSDNMSIVATLFPPARSLRRRSLSNVSVASFTSDSTPTPSVAPSTPHLPDTSPRSSSEIVHHHILQFAPRIADHLGARDILNFSATTRQCRDLRSSLAFQRHLALDGWDVEAIVRRAEMTKDTKGRPWMFLARSAVQKGDILTQYASLPKEGDEKSSSKQKQAVKTFLRILVDTATEHDRYNFGKLSSLAAELNMTFIQFVTAIQAHDWKTKCRKTFVIAAFTNAHHLYQNAESDLEGLADTLVFENPKPPVSLISARANFLYTYGCISSTTTSTPTRLTSCAYDPPDLCTSRGSSLPGLRQAVDRYKVRCAVKGFYRKAGGDVSSFRIALEPGGLISKSKLPFTERDLLTLSATLEDGEGHEPWPATGVLDMKTGVGKLKNATNDIAYELWTTPWGVVGEKIRNGEKHLGYFVLHW